MLLIIEPEALGPAESTSTAETAAETGSGPKTAANAKTPGDPSGSSGPSDPSDRAIAPGGSHIWPMRRGTLTALKKLSERGIQPAMKGGLHPEPGIQVLLEQEEISLADPEAKEWKEQPLDHLRVGISPDGSLILSKDGSSSKHASTGKPPDRKPPGNTEAGSTETNIVQTDAGSPDAGIAQADAGSPEADKAQNDPGPSFPDWPALAAWLLEASRTATRNRKTAETDISVRVNLDGTGKSRIETGIPFYDHMLDQIARHGYMDIDIACRGDLEIDEHHTIEDTAITLGEAIGEALGDKRGIGRYGFAIAMDETRSLVAIDLSGRPWCVFEGTFRREKVGDFPTEMTSHFFHSLAMALKATLHVSVKGENDHHQIEACFKGLARCLRQAVDRNQQYLDILPSSKGML